VSDARFRRRPWLPSPHALPHKLPLLLRLPLLPPLLLLSRWLSSLRPSLPPHFVSAHGTSASALRLPLLPLPPVRAAPAATPLSAAGPTPRPTPPLRLPAPDARPAAGPSRTNEGGHAGGKRGPPADEPGDECAYTSIDGAGSATAATRRDDEARASSVYRPPP
jgi:hypothetical protein